jgi:hypothetical protein
MLNLSDKDLDRLSQEAAQQHEPGDIVGPKFWDKLEARLDRDLGKMNPNPARGIRRLPYYYAPAVLVLLGVTYYLVRLSGKSQNNSSSPPLTAMKPAVAEPLKSKSLSPNPVSSDQSNSTPTAPNNTVQYPGTAAAGSVAGSAAGSEAGPTAAGGAGAVAPGGTSANTAAAKGASAGTGTPARTSASAGTRADLRAGTSAPAATSANLRAGTSAIVPAASASRSESAAARREGSAADSHTSSSSHHRRRNRDNFRGTAAGGQTKTAANASADNSTVANAGVPTTTGASTASATRARRDITFSAVRGPVRTTSKPRVDDAGLLAVDPNHIRELIHHGLRINRSLTFGLIAAPDYSSVNSLSGQKPGSTVGLTADYQFANHWYIGTGLLFSRKIFAAAPEDYHVPPNYYRNLMGVGGSDVAYIKGSFNMLEVPLNLRYDFNTGGNLLFFVNAGASSYFFTRQNCNYYFTWYNTGNVVDKQKTYTSNPNNLFASLNLSLGAELGISNSVSFMLAPYYKIPMRNLGFGQIQLSSVGIDFAIRFAPIISRRRY